MEGRARRGGLGCFGRQFSCQSVPGREVVYTCDEVSLSQLLEGSVQGSVQGYIQYDFRTVLRVVQCGEHAQQCGTREDGQEEGRETAPSGVVQ